MEPNPVEPGDPAEPIIAIAYDPPHRPDRDARRVGGVGVMAGPGRLGPPLEPALRFHHWHYRVGDPSAAMRHAAETFRVARAAARPWRRRAHWQRVRVVRSRGRLRAATPVTRSGVRWRRRVDSRARAAGAGRRDGAGANRRRVSRVASRPRGVHVAGHAASDRRSSARAARSQSGRPKTRRCFTRATGSRSKSSGTRMRTMRTGARCTPTSGPHGRKMSALRHAARPMPAPRIGEYRMESPRPRARAAPACRSADDPSRS